jgi:DNA-binding transcriptional MocR family regulator
MADARIETSGRRCYQPRRKRVEESGLGFRMPGMLAGMSATDPFQARYARGTRAMTASEIRALFSVAARPEIVSLAGGSPFTAALPMDDVRDLVDGVLDGEGPAALNYCGGQGDPRLRQVLAELMREEGIEASPDDIVVTVGSQQALDLLGRMFCDPGDVIVAEGPSYVGALSAFSQYQVDVVHVPMDADGLDPDALEVTLDRLAAESRRVKFLYTVPNFHNPAGVTLAEDRRDRVLEVARRHDVLVVEDNPYGLLGFEGPVPDALRARDADNVVYLGTLSKIFCPGLRVGWALVPPALRDRLILVKEAADLCSPQFSQAIAYHYFAGNPWRETIKTFREVYRERRDATIDALREGFGEGIDEAGVTWTEPDGGFYVWVNLPGGLDTRAMLPKAINARVAYVPGNAFYADDQQGRSHLRLCYSFPTPERIHEGVRRLTGVVAEELDLMRAIRGLPSGQAPGAGRHSPSGERGPRGQADGFGPVQGSVGARRARS